MLLISHCLLESNGCEPMSYKLSFFDRSMSYKLSQGFHGIANARDTSIAPQIWAIDGILSPFTEGLCHQHHHDEELERWLCPLSPKSGI